MTFLPETSHHKLPDTIEEGEEMGKGDTFYSFVAEKCCGRGNNEDEENEKKKKEVDI